MDSPEYYTPRTIPENTKTPINKYSSEYYTPRTTPLDNKIPIKKYIYTKSSPISSDKVIIDIEPEVIESEVIDPESTIKLRDADIIEDAQKYLALEEHAILFRLYNDMTNIKYIREKTPEQINLLNDDFKDKLQIFKKKYGSIRDYDLSIQSFEDKITHGRNKESLLKLFDEPSNFNNQIDIKNRVDLNIITDVAMIDKTGVSSSYIFKAKFSNKPCFIKAFFISENNLLYEQKIYRYIHTRNELIKPYYEDYFVKLYSAIKISSRDFISFLNDNNVKIITRSAPWNTNHTFNRILSYSTHIYLIITEDIEGMSYKEFYELNYKDEKLITNTLFDIFYGIYLMNCRLKLMHNDTHFGNIMIKIDLPITSTKYQIDKVEYTRNKNYKLCFYDFDLSFLEGEPNPHLDDTWVVQNKKSAKDIWTILNSLAHFILIKSSDIDFRAKQYFVNNIFANNLYDPDYWVIPGNSDQYKNLDYIGSIIKIILNNSKSHRETLERNYYDYVTTGIFWNAYCVNNIQDPCVIPDDLFLYPLEVLHRYVNDEHISNILNFIDVNPFYKKYVKYKTKYLELKKLNAI